MVDDGGTTGGTVRERILRLLATPPPAAALRDAPGSPSYIDLLGPEEEREPSMAQRVMESTFLPRIYERFWRPIGFNLAKGWPVGPDTAEEHALARIWLGLGSPTPIRSGSRETPPARPSNETASADRPPNGPAPRLPDVTVLDVACGPGNVTRGLGAGVGENGLVVGLDLASGMLERAAADTTAPHVGYVRGNAVDLPFRDGSFDAVCCFGALYLFEDPWAALDSMVRVLKPGGRLVVLTSRRPPLPLARRAGRALTDVTGFRLFGDREVTGFLRGRGLTEMKQRRYPGMQLVGARKPGPGSGRPGARPGRTRRAATASGEGRTRDRSRRTADRASHATTPGQG